MRGYFFEDAQIVNVEQIEPDLLGCSLFDHVENGLEDNQRETDSAAGDALNYFGERSERGIKDECTDFIGVKFCEHDRAETAHAAAPEDYFAGLGHFDSFSNLLNHLPDIKDLIDPISESFRVGVATSQHIKCYQIEAELGYMLHERYGL